MPPSTADKSRTAMTSTNPRRSGFMRTSRENTCVLSQEDARLPSGDEAPGESKHPMSELTLRLLKGIHCPLRASTVPKGTAPFRGLQLRALKVLLRFHPTIIA